MRMRYEWKRIGWNPVWFSAFLTGAFLVVCATGGETVPWGYLGFEVLYPFYMAVAVGAWCQTRTDPLFEVICAGGTSLFRWVLRRYLLLFCLLGGIAALGVAGMVWIKPTTPALDLLLAFLPTAFFLSSVSAALSMVATAPYIPALAGGILWLFSLMSVSLLRFAPVRYFYLFARYAGLNGRVWVANKVVLVLLGLALWCAIYTVCHKRLW